MALNFNPPPLPPSKSDRRQRNLDLILAGLNSLGNSYRQTQMDRYLQEDRNLKQKEIDYKYGKEIPQGMEIGLPTGQSARSSLIPGSETKTGAPASMGDYRSLFRASGYPKSMAQARPDVLEYLPEKERDMYYSKFETKPPTSMEGLISQKVTSGEIGMEDAMKILSDKEKGNVDWDKLHKIFVDRPEVKEYQIVSTQVRSMDALLNNALQGNLNNQLALDQALITMYNKLTDPNSVVRESEYARTPENLPVINRISGAIEKVKAGGAGLTNSDREALVLGAKIIANERGRTFMQTKGGYEELSNKVGVDPSLVTGTIPSFSPYDVTSKKLTKTIGGKTYIQVNGEWYEQ